MTNREKVSVSITKNPFTGKKYICISDLMAYLTAFRLDIYEGHQKNFSARDKEVALAVLKEIKIGLSHLNGL